MKSLKHLCWLALTGLIGCAEIDERMKITSYPETVRKDTILDFHGEQIADPYLWLEDDRSPETEAWVIAQNKLTGGYLESIPFRGQIRQRYESLFNFEKVGVPYRAGKHFFIYRNSGLEPQGKYFVREGLDGKDELFLDVNALSEDGNVSASLLDANDDHTLIAFSISEAGSDWSRIVVYDIATRMPLRDELRWVKFSGVSWHRDGFYYSRYPEPEKGKELSGNNVMHAVYYHRMGTPQAQDVLIFEDKKRPAYYHWSSITEDNKFLIVYASSGTDGFQAFWKQPDDKGAFRPLFADETYHSQVIESTPEGKLIVRTDVGAPRYRVVLVDPEDASPENWQELIPQAGDFLESVTTAGGKLFAHYLHRATTRVFQFNYDGTGKEPIPLPDSNGTAFGFSGKSGDEDVFYSFTSFTFPGMIYRYAITTGKHELFFSPEVNFNPQDYESRQVMVRSKDGTEVPMFIVHKKGLKRDGKNPAYLYGYGGFSVSMSPSFSTSRMILLEQGGVFAMANIRGGGEFGEDWHKAGMKEKKQNVFVDFISAAEWLIREGYTSSRKLAIAGGSNGGLLVGACMTQQPELFRVAFPEVGVLDMLRFHHFTVGKGWIPEYGCADSSRVEYDFLKAYSPYHNLKKEVSYPATLVMTADHDDRVVPAHSFKFAARLQEYHRGANPVLIRVEVSAGHGAGKSTQQVLDGESDRWAFFFYNTDTPYVSLR